MSNNKRIRKKIKPVILESPYAGDVKTNVRYARACMRDSLLKNEAPFASHLLYTQDGVLDDTNPNERTLGIEAGLCIGQYFHKSVIYTDLGISKGMEYGIERATKEKRKIEYRQLGENWYTQTNESVELLLRDVKFLLRHTKRVVDYNIAHDTLQVPGGLCEDTKDLVTNYKKIAEQIASEK